MLWDRISLARPPALPFCSGGGLALRTSPLAKAPPPGPSLERRNPRPGVQVWGANPGPAPLHPLGCPCPLLREELGGWVTATPADSRSAPPGFDPSLG
jgi:hypothetical protein